MTPKEKAKELYDYWEEVKNELNKQD
jgi:hypothetical protein